MHSGCNWPAQREHALLKLIRPRREQLLHLQLLKLSAEPGGFARHPRRSDRQELKTKKPTEGVNISSALAEVDAAINATTSKLANLQKV